MLWFDKDKEHTIRLLYDDYEDLCSSFKLVHEDTDCKLQNCPECKNGNEPKGRFFLKTLYEDKVDTWVQSTIIIPELVQLIDYTPIYEQDLKVYFTVQFRLDVLQTDIYDGRKFYEEYSFG